jgi:2-haloacid dehalogenase
VVAFDIIETTFSLAPLRLRLQDLGLPKTALEVWFAQILRDAFALAATDRYAPFGDVASATLESLAAKHGVSAKPEQVAAILQGFEELDPQPDAAAAMQHLRSQSIRIIALTNGAAEVTQTLLDRSGLLAFMERIISVAEIRKWKPAAAVYHHAAATSGVASSELALIAAHAWDVHGAKCAGLTAGFVARGRPFPKFMVAPDVTGESLADVAQMLAA